MKRKMLALVVAMLLLSGCAAQKPQAPTTVPEQSTGATTPETIPAPDVTVYTVDGQPVKLSDFFGKPIVLNFWASWCPPCKSEMPDFEDVYKELGTQVQFLMINLTDGTQETVESASGFIADSGYTFPVYYDTSMDAATQYGIQSIPTTYFIDTNGNVVAGATGALNAQALQKGIEMIR